MTVQSDPVNQLYQKENSGWSVITVLVDIIMIIKKTNITYTCINFTWIKKLLTKIHYKY